MNKCFFIKIILSLSNIKGVGKKTLLLFAYHIINNPPIIIPNTSDEYISLIEKILKSNSKFTYTSKEEIKIAYNLSLILIENTKLKNVRIISIIDENYPKKFLSLEDKPVIIYCKGENLNILNKNSLCIIGSRNISNYGKKIGTRLTKSIINKSYVVVSGLALGSDTIAHSTCVENKAPTIAIMAAGLDTIYPKANVKLSNEILKYNGLLISEYPIGIKPSRYSFVERDRLQAALAEATIVLETKIDGGSMHTAGYTLKQNKKLACLYSHVNDNLSEIDSFQGNKFLYEKKGAYRLCDENDLVNFINKISHEEKQLEIKF